MERAVTDCIAHLLALAAPQLRDDDGDAPPREVHREREADGPRAPTTTSVSILLVTPSKMSMR